MNEKVLKTLEFNKIIDLLASKAYSQAAKKRCMELKPMTGYHKIKEAQDYTSDALGRVLREGSISFSGLTDIGDILERLRLGASLSTIELLKICQILEISGRMKTYASKSIDDEKKDSLNAMFVALDPVRSLAQDIRATIISEDEIADDASTNLKSIRRKISGMNAKVHDELNKLINKESVRSMLQDNIITMRDGRFCLPVRAEYKSSMQGMVHDQSSTGSTVFIEPMAVVNLNNELRTLEIEEREEIAVILADLSDKAREYTITLESDYRVLIELDFIFAKAELAKDMNGVQPLFSRDRSIHLRRARHPMLDPKKAVPIDVELGGEFDLLIITGPNTGGKTVSLKTVGLLTLMGQAGLHIPAGDRSQLGIYDEVFADIGDEQSIEQNLSTFSSHMTNIIRIMKNVTDKSLVLFDELCAGTDPTEGAALAISILDDLHTRGIKTMATTHYSEIKVYALETEGIQNASCEFDVATLSPTYRLLIGVPGRSNAFAISEKLGLDKYLIDRAKIQIDSSQASFEELIAGLQEDKVQIEKNKAEALDYRAKHMKLAQDLSRKQDKIEERKAKIIREANEEAARILKEAKDLADETIRDFNKYKASNPDIRDMEMERAILRDEINKKQDGARIKPSEKVTHKKSEPPKNLRIGDTVHVVSMNTEGTVHTLPDAKGKLMVQMGILKSQVSVDDIVVVDPEAETKAMKAKYAKKAGVSAGKVKMSKSMSVSAEIMLLGKRADEAIYELDKYLDDAYLAHLPSVRIVHGKGSGALRQAVHQHLRKMSTIAEFHLGEFGEGDAGVTIAVFK